MRAYKCDRCGEYFNVLNKYDNSKVCISILVANRWTTADLCKECINGLEYWFYAFKILKKEVDNNEMDAKAEQEIPSYGGLEETKEDEE